MNDIGVTQYGWSTFSDVSRVSNLVHSLGHMVFSQVSLIERDLFKPVPSYVEASKRKINVTWYRPLYRTFKVNVDGFHLSESSLAWGGLIHDFTGTFIKGFDYNLGSCNAIVAELWALF